MTCGCLLAKAERKARRLALRIWSIGTYRTVLSTLCIPLLFAGAIPASRACELRPGAAHTVADVIDGQTLRLADGTIVRLADIIAPSRFDIPLPPSTGPGATSPSAVRPEPAVDVSLNIGNPSIAKELALTGGDDRSGEPAQMQRDAKHTGTVDGPALGSPAGRVRPLATNSATVGWPAATDAAQALRALVQGQTIELAVVDDKTAFLRDRYGRLRSQVRMASGSETIWIQERLLRMGLARIAFAPEQTPCVGVLRPAERSAEQARLGLWQHAAYSPRRADRARTLLRYAGTLQVVEGRVHGVASTKGRTYLNFGPDRRVDFTVSFRSRLRKPLREAGIEPDALTGKTVRVRGWITRRGGPLIELTDPAQIEVADGGDQEAAARHGHTQDATATRAPRLSR